MYRILIVSEDFVLRKAVAFSLNDLDACVECADTVGAMLVLHRESPFDLVIVMGTAAEMCRQEVMDTLRADKTRRTRVFVISWPQSEQMVRSMYRMGVNQLHDLAGEPAPVAAESHQRANRSGKMEMTFWWCIGAVLVSGAVLAGSWCVQRFAGRFCLRRDAERREKYLNSVLWMLFSGTEECAHCPEAMSSRDRRLIAEDIADLVDSTYGLDPAPLRRIVERQRLDVFLLRRIRRNGGYRRAYYLHLLSRMPVDEKTVRAVERYTHSRNRYVRFCALSVQMMADMSALSSKIDAYSHRLSYFELSEVLRMLRQNVQPVDYEPLILSPNRNLRMLGLSVVWRFGIEDAEEILLRIVAENRSEESVGAMYVLCTLHSVITRPEVEKFVGGMNPVQRRVLLRYIARQGYSANALQVFIPEEEKRYYVSLVDSYKLNVG